MIETCSSAGFPKILGHINKNISCTIFYSQQPRVFTVISLLSIIYSMKPCIRAITWPIISIDNMNEKADHTWLVLYCACVCTVTFSHCNHRLYYWSAWCLFQTKPLKKIYIMKQQWYSQSNLIRICFAFETNLIPINCIWIKCRCNCKCIHHRTFECKCKCNCRICIGLDAESSTGSLSSVLY